MTAHKLEDGAFATTWRAAPRQRDSSPKLSMALSRVFGMRSDADEAGAAWAVGAAARMPWSDEDDHSSTAESGSESSAGEETPVVERPPAPRAPFGVRLANRGAALVPSRVAGRRLGVRVRGPGLERLLGGLCVLQRPLLCVDATPSPHRPFRRSRGRRAGRR